MGWLLLVRLDFKALGVIIEAHWCWILIVTKE